MKREISSPMIAAAMLLATGLPATAQTATADEIVRAVENSCIADTATCNAAVEAGLAQARSLPTDEQAEVEQLVLAQTEQGRGPLGSGR